MSQQVEYELSLKDFFTGKIKTADQAVHALEGSVHNAAGQMKILAAEMGAAIGVGIGVFKLVQLTEEGLHKFHELHLAEAQLENTLKNVGTRAGITADEMIAFAKKSAQQIPMTAAAIVNMEGAVSRFRITSKDTFEKIIQLSQDVAVATGRDGTEVSSALGMIFEKPEAAMRKLRQFNIIFSHDQQKMIAHLVASGQQAKVTQLLFQELAARGYAGAAKAAADTDPLFKYHKAVAALQMTLGELAFKLQKYLAPALEWFVGTIRGSIQWMREFWQWIVRNQAILKDIAIVIGVTTAAWALYTVVSQAAVIWSTIKAAAFAIEAGVLTALGTAVEFVNAMFLASPIGWIVIGIAAVTTAVIYCWKHFAKFRAVLFGVWETIKEFARIVADIFMGLWHVIHGIFTFNKDEITSGMDQHAGAILNSGKRLGAAFKKGFDEGMEDFAKDQAKEKEENAPKTIAKPKAIQGPAGENGKTPQMKATGSKNVSIVVNINQLVGKYEVQTKNIVEGAGKAKEIVVQALLSAVNDSQIIAGQ